MLLDGEADEELRGPGRDAEGSYVPHAPRVVPDEYDGRPEAPVAQARREGDEAGPHGAVCNLVADGDVAVLAEEPLLHGGGEAVEGEVRGHEEAAKEVLDALQAVLEDPRPDLSREDEGGAAKGDDDRGRVLCLTVVLAVHERPPDHNRDHLCALCKGGYREAHVLKGVVLAGGREGVGERDAGVALQRSSGCQ